MCRRQLIPYIKYLTTNFESKWGGEGGGGGGGGEEGKRDGAAINNLLTVTTSPVLSSRLAKNPYLKL